MTPSSRKEFFMFENIWFIAAVWMGLALVASLISIRTGISVALIEILVGVIAGIALSTTSVAIVYAVMIEGGFSDTAMGKMILAACFITDFGTVLALGTLFANYNLWLLLFVIATLIVLWFMPRWTQSIITRLGATQVSEPEVKFIFFVLFFLGGLATTAKSEAVLPAYLLGLVVAGVSARDALRAKESRDPEAFAASGFA